jgi:hypothetical protein
VRANAQLQNQENSGEAEMELMRREQEAVSARYDEERQGEVMDKTPPRIGRMERFIRDRQGASEEWDVGTGEVKYKVTMTLLLDMVEVQVLVSSSFHVQVTEYSWNNITHHGTKPLNKNITVFINSSLLSAIQISSNI